MVFKPCLSVLHFAARLDMVLEGRRTASGASRERKVRTPKGAMPRNPGLFGRDTRGRTPTFCRGSTDSATENQTAEIVAALCERRKKCDGYRPPLQLARVKRCGKSAPLEAQATRHGKPHRVQGQIGNPGAARSRFRESGTDSGYRLHRQMVLSPEEIRGRQNSAYSPSKTISNSQIRRDELHESHANQPKVMDSYNLSLRLIQNYHPFPGTHRLGLLDRGGRTHIANPVHRADGNHLRPGIFKRPRRLIGRQNFRRPNLVGAILQNPQPRRFAVRFPTHTQTGPVVFDDHELRFDRRQGSQPRRCRHERGLRVGSANHGSQGRIVRQISQVIKDFAARGGLVAHHFDLADNFIRSPLFPDIGGVRAPARDAGPWDSVAPTN